VTAGLPAVRSPARTGGRAGLVAAAVVGALVLLGFAAAFALK
jgi:hypothetical protein